MASKEIVSGDEAWDMLYAMNNRQKEMLSSKCQFCGAPLPISKARNGICKCEWCRAENIVGYVYHSEYYEPEAIDATCLGDTEKRIIFDHSGSRWRYI